MTYHPVAHKPMASIAKLVLLVPGMLGVQLPASQSVASPPYIPAVLAHIASVSVVQVPLGLQQAPVVEQSESVKLAGAVAAVVPPVPFQGTVVRG